MKKTLLLCLGIFILIVMLLLIHDNKIENNILYSWSMSALTDNELLDVIDKYHISTIYQDFSTEYLKSHDDTFMIYMKNKKVEVYHLCGEKEWALEKNAISMKKEIDKVVAYNQTSSYKIKGIVFDVEPYQNEKNIEENFDFSLYVSNMKKAYKYSKSKGLKMVIAIPIWFDNINEKLLKKLIKDGCDEISLMNYNIKYTKEHMKKELKYAKKYNKSINTIYEINFKDDNYFSNYKEIDKDFEKLQEYYGYEKLRKAYHHYDKMKED